MEVVSEPSILEETAGSHLQDYLSSSRSLASHFTLTYSRYDLLCLDEKCTMNKNKLGIFLIKESSRPPTVLVNDIRKVELMT